MFCLHRPTPREIERFLSNSRALPLSYEPVGLVRDPSTPRRIDEQVVTLGHGSAAFASACRALRAWKQFQLGWVELFPRNAAIDRGTVVAVLIRHLGFWSLNGARVVYNVDDGGSRFGYAYGTLTNHAESGEELFEIALEAHTGAVTYRIRATSTPQAPLAYLGHPIARVLQARFRRDSASAMRRAT